MNKTRVEIFCGTGGVGKTTISTSRALYLAQNKKCLLMTIDPSKRLKTLLNIQDEGEVLKISHKQSQLDVILLSADKTFKSMGNHKTNRILDILMKPNGGMHEIMSLIELNNQYQSKKYDVIILDTAPGGHFLDFLSSAERVRQFFDNRYIEFINQLNQNSTFSPFNLAKKVIQSGLNPILSYLKKVTGENYVNEFIETIQIFFQYKNQFLQAIEMVKLMTKEDNCHWYLVTSTEHLKNEEAIALQKKAIEMNFRNGSAIINKFNEDKWNSDLLIFKENPEAMAIIQSFIHRENYLSKMLSEHFKSIIKFPEVMIEDSSEQLQILINDWNQHEL